jgi:hypothetical protein
LTNTTKIAIFATDKQQSMANRALSIAPAFVALAALTAPNQGCGTLPTLGYEYAMTGDIYTAAEKALLEAVPGPLKDVYQRAKQALYTADNLQSKLALLQEIQTIAITADVISETTKADILQEASQALAACQAGKDCEEALFGIMQYVKGASTAERNILEAYEREAKAMRRQFKIQNEVSKEVLVCMDPNQDPDVVSGGFAYRDDQNTAITSDDVRYALSFNFNNGGIVSCPGPMSFFSLPTPELRMLKAAQAEGDEPFIIEYLRDNATGSQQLIDQIRTNLRRGCKGKYNLRRGRITCAEQKPLTSNSY